MNWTSHSRKKKESPKYVNAVSVHSSSSCVLVFLLLWGLWLRVNLWFCILRRRRGNCWPRWSTISRDWMRSQRRLKGLTWKGRCYRSIWTMLEIEVNCQSWGWWLCPNRLSMHCHWLIARLVAGKHQVGMTGSHFHFARQCSHPKDVMWSF